MALAGQPHQLVVERLVGGVEGLQHQPGLGVAAVLVVDDGLQHPRLREVLVLEVGGLQREQVAERLLVLADAVVGVGGLPEPLQPLRPAPRHLAVVEDGVAVLPVLVVEPGQLQEGQLPQLDVPGPPLPGVGEPDHVLELLHGRRLVAQGVAGQPVDELGTAIDVAVVVGPRHLGARRPGLLADQRRLPAGLAPRGAGLLGLAGLVQRPASLELVLGEEEVEAVLVLGGAASRA